MIIVFFLLEIPNRPNTQVTFREKVRQLNGLGVLALLPGVICLCLAIQWGGTTYAVSLGIYSLTYHVIFYYRLVELITFSGAMGVLLRYLCLGFFF